MYPLLGFLRHQKTFFETEISSYIPIGSDTDWDVMCSSVPVGVGPLTSTRAAGVYITSTSNTMDSWLGCSRRSGTHKGCTVPVVFKLLIAPLLRNSKFQKLYLSYDTSAYYCYRSLRRRREVEMEWEERREEKDRREAVSNHGSTFFLSFFFSERPASEKCVFVNVQDVQQPLLRFQSCMSISLLWGFPFVRASR